MPSALDRQWAASEGVVLIDAGAAGIRAWWLQGPGQEEVTVKSVSALSIVVQSDATVGDTMKSCADGAFLLQ